MRRGASLGAQGQEDLGFSLEGMWSGLEQRAALAGRPAHLELLSEAPARLGGRGPRGPWDDRRGPRGALEPLRLPICPRAPPGAAAPRPGPNACREWHLGVWDPVSGRG